MAPLKKKRCYFNNVIYFFDSKLNSQNHCSSLQCQVILHKSKPIQADDLLLNNFFFFSFLLLNNDVNENSICLKYKSFAAL